MRKLLLFLLLPTVAFAMGGGGSEGRKLKSDEEIRFYPTMGKAADGFLLLQGRVAEPERDSAKRKFFLAQVGDWMGFSKEERASPYFEERGLCFLEDDKENVRVTLSLPGGETWVAKSGEEGYLDQWVAVPAFQGGERYVRFTSKPGDGREFKGSAWMLADEGFSIVSDIDDTVKITQVLDRGEMLRNTFVRPFRAVPGMAELYRRLLAKGGGLHFVSAGPKQLTGPLEEFLEKEGFPPFSLQMRFFHLDPGTIGEISSGAENFKVTTIGALFKRFSKRRFLLVGDSGEKDPEAYARLLAEFPGQVTGVWIRDVTGEAAGSPRYEKLYSGEAKSLLRVFHDPKEL